MGRLGVGEHLGRTRCSPGRLLALCSGLGGAEPGSHSAPLEFSEGSLDLRGPEISCPGTPEGRSPMTAKSSRVLGATLSRVLGATQSRATDPTLLPRSGLASLQTPPPLPAPYPPESTAGQEAPSLQRKASSSSLPRVNRRPPARAPEAEAFGGGGPDPQPLQPRAGRVREFYNPESRDTARRDPLRRRERAEP